MKSLVVLNIFLQTIIVTITHSQEYVMNDPYSPSMPISIYQENDKDRTETIMEMMSQYPEYAVMYKQLGLIRKRGFNPDAYTKYFKKFNNIPSDPAYLWRSPLTIYPKPLRINKYFKLHGFDSGTRHPFYKFGKRRSVPSEFNIDNEELVEDNFGGREDESTRSIYKTIYQSPLPINKYFRLRGLDSRVRHPFYNFGKRGSDTLGRNTNNEELVEDHFGEREDEDLTDLGADDEDKIEIMNGDNSMNRSKKWVYYLDLGTGFGKIQFQQNDS